jgi:hypothetical protein
VNISAEELKHEEQATQGGHDVPESIQTQSTWFEDAMYPEQECFDTYKPTYPIPGSSHIHMSFKTSPVDITSPYDNIPTRKFQYKKKRLS